MEKADVVVIGGGCMGTSIAYNLKKLGIDGVTELSWKGQIIYQCELCGFFYRDVETAERCEQYCYSHGRPSPRITGKAIRKPSVQVDPIAA